MPTHNKIMYNSKSPKKTYLDSKSRLQKHGPSCMHKSHKNAFQWDAYRPRVVRIRGVYLVPGGTWSRGVYLVRGGVCQVPPGTRPGTPPLLGPDQVPPRDQTRYTPPWTESQTPVKTLPWPNFVAAGNKTSRSCSPELFIKHKKKD